MMSSLSAWDRLNFSFAACFFIIKFTMNRIILTNYTNEGSFLENVHYNLTSSFTKSSTVV